MADEKQMPPPAAKKGKGTGPKMQQVMRFAETNLEGRRPAARAIQRIMGVGSQYARAVALAAEVGNTALGDLSEPQLQKLEDVLNHPQKYNIPAWLYNRRRDPTTGADNHLIVSRLSFAQREDINALKKIRAYKGVRHGLGLPVRGQRTRSSGRGTSSVGVQRKKAETKPAGDAKKEQKK